MLTRNGAIRGVTRREIFCVFIPFGCLPSAPIRLDFSFGKILTESRVLEMACENQGFSRHFGISLQTGENTKDFISSYTPRKAAPDCCFVSIPLNPVAIEFEFYLCKFPLGR